MIEMSIYDLPNLILYKSLKMKSGAGKHPGNLPPASHPNLVIDTGWGGGTKVPDFELVFWLSFIGVD